MFAFGSRFDFATMPSTRLAVPKIIGMNKNPTAASTRAMVEKVLDALAGIAGGAE
jgi:hypothetical protein